MSQVNARFAVRRPWEEVNDADKQEVIRALALGYSVNQAAKVVKRKPAVIFEWARTDAGFAAALNAIAADKDDEVTDFRERVRRAAGTMLDHLLEMADPRVNPVTLQPVHMDRERNAAIKTFFADVHGPVLLPKTSNGPQAPTVLVHASQAQFLVQGARTDVQVDAPTNGHGDLHATTPLRHDDLAAAPQPSTPAPSLQSGAIDGSPSGAWRGSASQVEGIPSPSGDGVR